MKLRLPSKLQAALIAALAAVSSTAYSGTIGETVTPYTLPQNGGTVHQWTGGAGTTDSQSDANWTNGKPARSNNLGPVLVFDGANVTLTNVNGSIDTSDSGGIKVINNSIVTANSLLGRWAGSVYVEEGSELTTSYSTKLKNSEAATAANIYVDGTFNLTGSNNMNISDGNKYENWHIGENGIINITNSNGSVTKASGGSWNFEFVVNNTKSYEKEIIGRELSDSVKVSKTVLTSNNAIALSNVDTYRIINTSNVLLGDETTTGQENAAKLRLDGKNWVVDYTMKGYTAATLTWNGGNNGAWEDLDAGWTLNGEPATFISGNGDSVVFGSAGGKDVAINSAIVVKGVTVDEPGYTFNVTGGSLAAQTVTLNSNLSINGAGTATIGSLALNSGTELALGEGTVLKGTAATLMGQKVTGDGAILLDSNLTLSNGTTTQATAGLIVKGATLHIGSAESHTVNISSLSHVVLDGGTILYAANASSAINGLTVESGKTGTVRIDDITEQNLVFAGTTKIDGTLNLSNNWNSQFKFNKLVGAGTLSTVKGGNQWMTLTIDSLSDGDLKFTGDISYAHNNGDAKDKVIINTGSQEVSFRSLSLDINTGHTMQFNLGADTTIGQMTLTSGTAAFTGTGKLTLGGLDGGATITGLNDLTLNVTGGSHAYTGTLSVGGKLVKSGAGAQTITGYTMHDSITVEGGTLTLTGDYAIGAIPQDPGSITYYTDAQGVKHLAGSDPANGFISYNATITVYTVTGEGSSLNTNGARFLFGDADQDVTTEVVQNNGVFTKPATPDYTTLYVNAGATETPSFAAYKAYALTQAPGTTLGKIHMDNGTQVNMDEAATVALTLAEGASATVNATAATTLGSISGLGGGQVLTVTGTQTVTLGSTLNSAGTIKVDGGKLALGQLTHTLTALEIDNGGYVSALGVDSSAGCVSGNISIGADSTFEALNGGHNDVFGYNNPATDAIIMQGRAAGQDEAEAHWATLLLNNPGSATMTTDLTLKGYAKVVTREGERGFNAFGTTITVSGVENHIDRFEVRNATTIQAAPNATAAELTVGDLKPFYNNGNPVSNALTVNMGATGRLTVDNTVNVTNLTLQSGSLDLQGAATITGNVSTAAGSALTTAAAAVTGSVTAGGAWTNTGVSSVGGVSLAATASLANIGTLTVNGNFTMAAGATVDNSGTVAFSGAHTLTFTQGGFTNTDGTLTFSSGTVFDLSQLEEDTATHTYTLVNGGTADLSQYGYTVNNITGFRGEGQASDYGWTFGNGVISYSTFVDYVWQGTATEWADGAAGWQKNGVDANYVSSSNSNAVFNASAEEQFVKDIAVNSALQTGNVTVKDAYTFTLDNAHISASAISVEGDNASLTINGTGTVSTTGISAAGKTVTLDSGVLLQGGSADAMILAGSGTYALGTGTTALGNVSGVDTWTGTVKISGVPNFEDINPNSYGNAHSSVELDGVTGFFLTGANTFATHLVLSGDGVTFNNGYSSGVYTFAGGISGDGSFTYNAPGKNISQRLVFSGDISQWNGALNLTTGYTVTAVFAGAEEVNAQFNRTGGTLNIEVGDGTGSYETAFKKSVAVNSLSLKSNTATTFDGGLTVNNKLALDGPSAPTNVALTFGGNAEFKGGFSTSFAQVTIAGGTTRLSGGELDLATGRGEANSSITVKAGAALDIAGHNLWMRPANTILLEQGGTVVMPAAITAVGLGNGATIKMTNTGKAGTQYGIGSADYTLSQVKVTFNSAQDNVQNIFTDAELAVVYNVTLKNTDSTLRGATVNNGAVLTVAPADLTVDTSMALGAVTLSGGALALGTHTVGAVDSLAVAEGTTNTISGYKLDMGTAGAVALGGGSSLTLDGVTVDLTHMASEGEDVQTLVGGSDGAGKNGFVNLESKVRLFSYGADASVVLTNDPTFLRGVNTGTLTTEGDNKGLVTFNGTSYSAFYVNVPEITEHLASIVEAASTHGGLQAVYLNGGTLDADTDDKIAELHLMEGDGAQGSVALTGPTANFGAVTGAGILNVDGATTLNADSLLIGAGKTVTFAGSENINITSITNNGMLDIGAGAKVTTTATAMGGNGTSFVTTGEGTFVGNAFSLVGGTVSFGSDAQISGGDVLARSGELIIGGHTVIDGTLQGGDGSGKTARISVLEGGVLDVDTFNASWGWSSFNVDGVLNVADTMRLSTGGENYVVGGKGLVNTEKLTIQNVGKYFFDGTDGLTLQVGAGGITNGNDGSSLTLENGLCVLAGADMTVAKNATLVGNVIFDSNGNKMTISSILSGNGGLTKEGAGTLTLSGANTYTGDTVVKGGTLDIQGSISDNSKVKVEESANIAGRTENITVGIASGETATFTNESGYTPKDSHVTFSSKGLGVVVSNLGDTEAVYSLDNGKMRVTAQQMVVDISADQDVQVDNVLAVQEITNLGPVSLKLTSVVGKTLDDVIAYAGDIEIDNLEEAQRLRELSIADGRDVTFLLKPESPEAVAQEATVTIAESVWYDPETGAEDYYYGGTLHAGGGTLHANLVLSHFSFWDLDGGSMNLGSELTLRDNIWLDADTIKALDLMKIGETHWMVNAVDGTQITYSDADVWYDSKFVRDAYENDGTSLKGDFIIVQDNDGTKWGLKKVSDTPEPTTGTLSLLALAALAARRRRR